MNNKLPKNLIFDFDHTLIDLEIDWQKGDEALVALFKKINSDLYNETANLDINLLINNFYKIEGKDFKNMFLDFARDFEENNLTSYRPNLELFKKIHKLHSTHNLSIWSSNTKNIIVRLLEEYLLKELFDKIISIDDVDYIKPSGSGFQLILNDNFPNKSDYIMIGDSKNDSDCAKDAGIQFIHVDEFMKVAWSI